MTSETSKDSNVTMSETTLGQNTSMALVDDKNASVTSTETVTSNTTAIAPRTNTSGFTEVPHGAFVAAEVAAILCSVLGSAGNIFTLVTIIITPKLRENANNLFVCNLSAADTLFCAIILPVKASVLHLRRWIWNDTFCIWFAASEHTIFGIAVFSLCTIAVNRFVNVVYPQHKDRLYTRRKIAAMLVLCWLSPVILNIPAVFEAWGEYSFHEEILSCTFGRDNTMDTDTHGVVIYASFLAVPVLLMAGSYCSIGIVFYKSRRRVLKHRPPSDNHWLRDAQGRQLTLSMLITCVLFIICVGPNTVVGVVDPNMSCRVCHVITPLFAWVQFSLNPVVYTITNAQFQDAYKRLLRLVFTCPGCGTCGDCCEHQCCVMMSSTARAAETSQVNIEVMESST